VTLVGAFDAPACVIVKHNEPCGVAIAATPAEAYEAALKTDEQSAFGGVVAFNRALDAPTAGLLAKQFVEVVAAPDFEQNVNVALQQKRNLRLVRLAPEALRSTDPWSVRLLGRGRSSSPSPWAAHRNGRW